MPATAGKVRMPHNNRMSTSATLKSSSIWQNAIGHDPYANATEKEEQKRDASVDAEKVKNVMEMARSQNVTDGANRDDFTARMYLGLKRGKQRKSDLNNTGESIDPHLKGILEDPSSSSEEEFVEVTAAKKDKKKDKPSKKRKQREKKYYSSSSDDSSSSSDDEDRRERRRRGKKKKKRHRKRREYESDDSSDSSDNGRKKRKEKRRRRGDKKRSSRK